MKPIDLYVAPPSPTSRAVIIAARYMNINVKLIIIDLMKNEQKEDWFVKMNPQHCLPTINDNGFILWESRAIMTYMANKYAPNNPIYPNNPKIRGRVDCLLQYDLNVLNRAITDLLIPLKHQTNNYSDNNNHNQNNSKEIDENNGIIEKISIKSNNDNDHNNSSIIRSNNDNEDCCNKNNNKNQYKYLNTIKERKVNESLEYLESILINSRYLIDNNYLTLADISIYCSLEFADKNFYNLKKYQNLFKYFQQMKLLLNGYLYNSNYYNINDNHKWLIVKDDDHNNNDNDDEFQILNQSKT